MTTSTPHVISASITERGQVTIPAEVRRLLGLGAPDKVEFVVEGDTVTLRKAAFTLESLYGSVPPLKRPKDWRQVRQAVAEDRATAYEEKLGRTEG